jgi:hypothetical protein
MDTLTCRATAQLQAAEINPAVSTTVPQNRFATKSRLQKFPSVTLFFSFTALKISWSLGPRKHSQDHHKKEKECPSLTTAHQAATAATAFAVTRIPQ